MADTTQYFLEIEGLKKYDALIKQHIPLVWTKEYYESQKSTFVPYNGQMVIIQNYREVGEGESKQTIAAIKLGDGTTVVERCLFIDTFLWEHVKDESIHVSSSDREYWNNKLSDVTIDENEKMKFSRN